MHTDSAPHCDSGTVHRLAINIVISFSVHNSKTIRDRKSNQNLF